MMITKGISPKCSILNGRFKLPVPSTLASSAKMDPLMVPFLTGRYGPLTDGLLTLSFSGARFSELLEFVS